MRPALWIVRFSGEFPDWRVRHSDGSDGEVPGWYANCPSMGKATYAASAVMLRKAMARCEHEYADGR